MKCCVRFFVGICWEVVGNCEKIVNFLNSELEGIDLVLVFDKDDEVVCGRYRYGDNFVWEWRGIEDYCNDKVSLKRLRDYLEDRELYLNFE